jgi:hypothetical protein
MSEEATYWMWEERLFAVMTVVGMGIQYVYLTTLAPMYRVLYRNSGILSLRPTVELCVSMWFQLVVLAASVTLLAFAVRPGVLRTSRLQLLIISALFSVLSSMVLVHVGTSLVPHGF